MQIGIVGLGLIGGSLAKAAKERTDYTVLGFDRNEAVLQQALQQGAIDGVLEPDQLKNCRIVLVALYPQAAVDYILSHRAAFGNRTIVVDCCGVKEVVCTPCESAAREAGFVFLGRHPMAGIERSGFAFSKGDLFEGASMVLTPPAGTDRTAVDTVSGFCMRWDLAASVFPPLKSMTE